MPCQAHLGEVTQAHKEWAQRGCSVVFIVQAAPAVLQEFLKREPQVYDFLSDESGEVYTAFGLNRLPLWRFFHPRIIWGYLRYWWRGVPIRLPYAGENVRQLGGDFLFDAAGECIYAFRSQDPTVRPTVADLLAHLPESPR